MTELVKEVLGRYPDAGVDRLIPILQDVQEAEGYLSVESLHAIAAHLRIASGEVFGVATFYNQFRFEPSGKCRVTVCRGTACHVRGGKRVLNKVEQRLGVSDGETTPDFQFTLETVACLGACALAPVMVVDKAYHGKMTPQKVDSILDRAEGK
jgi:NADH-quinone oxidoreductase E subunit